MTIMKILTYKREVELECSYYSMGLLIVLLVLGCSFGSTHAQNVRTWTGLAEGTYDWGNSNNWSATTVPTINDSAALRVDIAGNVIINLNGNRTINAMTIGDTSGGSSITIAAGTNPSSKLIFAGPSNYNPEITKDIGGVDTITAMVDFNKLVRANITTS
jgi:hypothetical protein